MADIDNGKILKIDPTTNTLVKEIPADMLFWQGTLGVGEGSVWVVTAKGGLDKVLTQLNAGDGMVEATIPLPSAGTGVVVDFGSVWVVGNGANELYRIDPKTNTIVATTKVHKQPLYVCSADNSLWVFNQGDELVDRIDGRTGKVLATIDTGFPTIHGGDFTCGGGYVWGDQPGTPLVQIDPKTNTTIRKFSGQKGFGWSLRYGGGSLWFSGASIRRVEPPRSGWRLGEAVGSPGCTETYRHQEAGSPARTDASLTNARMPTTRSSTGQLPSAASPRPARRAAALRGSPRCARGPLPAVPPECGRW